MNSNQQIDKLRRRPIVDTFEFSQGVVTQRSGTLHSGNALHLVDTHDGHTYIVPAPTPQDAAIALMDSGQVSPTIQTT